MYTIGNRESLEREMPSSERFTRDTRLKHVEATSIHGRLTIEGIYAIAIDPLKYSLKREKKEERNELRCDALNVTGHTHNCKRYEAQRLLIRETVYYYERHSCMC